MKRQQADRLRAELRDSSPNAHGIYLLDMAEYQALSLEEIGRILHQEGWQPTRHSTQRLRTEMALTRIGDTGLSPSDRTFIQGDGPEQLRQNPHVAARADEIRRERSFDPLSDRGLNKVRERHRYWQKKFNRQIALASLYTIVGGVLLGAFFASDELDWESGSAYVILAIPVILLLLACVSVYKSVRIRKARHAEIGAFLNAYAELSRLARADSTADK